MKNILKKIGVIGIIIAMLAPFVEMPVVKAAETKTCTDHTVAQYYFLDVTNGNEWKQYQGDGYKTYAIFKYLSPNVSSGQELNILNTKVLDLVTSGTSNNTMTLGDYYGDIQRLHNNENAISTDTKITGSYETKEKSSAKYVKVLHGLWAKSGESDKSSTWSNVPEGNNGSAVFTSHTIQKLGMTGTVTLNAAQYNTTSYFSDYSYSGNDLADYFVELSKNNKNFIYEDGDSKYFAIGINRKLEKDELNKFAFGKQCETVGLECSEDDVNNKKWYILTTDANSTNSDKTIKDSYDALIGTNNNTYRKIFDNEAAAKTAATAANKEFINTKGSYYWPVVLNVEYELCTNTSEKWTLKYDGNTPDDSATNLPQPDTVKDISVGTGVQVDSKTPSRSGYTFKGWNTEKDGTGTWYKAGEEVKSDVADVITLFAQWGDTSKGDQKSTGVASYIIGFISVGIVASGIYLIAKKKNLFKQI